ncbi:hypothetical protein NDA03_26395 [Trichocoleus sp. Lan]|uniref:hypothetical protein n=1 Tax=Trichocoleus sp. Lan TaxID=2933927 RepID=UPI0032985719
MRVLSCGRSLCLRLSKILLRTNQELERENHLRYQGSVAVGSHFLQLTGVAKILVNSKIRLSLYDQDADGLTTMIFGEAEWSSLVR